MAKEGQRMQLSEMVELNRTCRDYSSQQERQFWRGFLWVSIPLIVIIALENVAAEFGYGDRAMPWWLLAILTILLVAACIGLVWHWQRQRKSYEERMAFHQQKMREGFTYLVVENGKQNFYK